MATCISARLIAAALLLVCSSPAHAGPLTIDLRTALARARERAPAAIAARARIDEARARRIGAGVLLTQNPELEVGAGRRFGDPNTLALDAQLAQPLELLRRGPRIGVADAEVAHAQASNAAALRELDLEVTTRFYEARYAELFAAVVSHDSELAARGYEAAARRRKAGEVTDLDVDLAAISLGRARAAVAAAQAQRADAVGRLAVLIGANPDDAITLAGDLAPDTLALDELRAAVLARADVRELAAESSVAHAEARLARANARPDVGVWIGYQLDETDPIVVGGLTLMLPMWNRAQGERAQARAKARRADAVRAAVTAAASRQVLDAFEAYARARDAVAIFERDVVPAIADAELLLDRSITSGQLAIDHYLTARQEILGGRREHLERQLQLARAAATARFVAGVSP